MSLYKQKFNPVSGTFSLVPTATIVTFKDGVANAAALPVSGNALNDGRITADTGHLYVWNGTSWIDSGDIVDLKWSAIDGKPTSSVVDIDSAVSNSHAPHSDDQVIPDQLSDLADDATHRLVTDAEKISWNSVVSENSSIILNIMLNAFRIAQIGALSLLKMIDGWMDEYEDESGVDLVNSVNQIYNGIDDYYKNYQPSDSETVLLLHFNNNVTDSSQIPKTVTNNGVTFSDTVKELGSHSAYFNGSSYISIPTSSDFNFGTEDVTIDFWFYPTATASNIFIFHDTYPPNSPPRQVWYLEWNGGDNNNFTINHYDGAGSNSFNFGFVWTPTINQWYHIAFVRYGTTGKIAINGVFQTITVGNANLGTKVWGHDSVNPLYIGATAEQFIQGYIDEFRISKGVARWIDDFITPSIEYSITELVSNMTLISNTQVAQNVPSEIRAILFEEDIDSVTLNADLKAYVSRDGGTTFTQVTLEDEGNYITGAKIISGSADVSLQPSGTNIVYKITTHNNKRLNIHGTAVSWK
jgi:hypothetical protein